VNKTPKISIVIPSFNKASYIGITLDSIFQQKYSNLEVIVQDGGSTDGTVEIIKKFAEEYPIIWESKKDKGQVDAINRGFLKATGEILAFINADDLYSPDAFLSVLNAYTNNPNALWFAGYGKIINEEDVEIAKFWISCKNILLRLNSYFLLLLTSNYLMQPSVFITKEAYQKFGPFTGVGKYIFEYEMWLKLGRVSMPVIIPSTLSKFRISKSNMSSLYYNELFKKDLEVTRRFSKNSFVVLLHRVNNFLRLLSIKSINK
jgi:glycosyltransferase involved in cell wall biosynthesis